MTGRAIFVGVKIQDSGTLEFDRLYGPDEQTRVPEQAAMLVSSLTVNTRIRSLSRVPSTEPKQATDAM
jgi:hypothetical protein